MNRFEVSKAGFEEHRVAPVARRELDAGEVRLAIDFFAFTANNMTYAVAGDILNYWQFFPVEDDPGFGVIPVWGFADVVESRCDELDVGERLYGYFPPADELIIQPKNVSGGHVFDGSEHRQSLSPLYNRYQRVHGDGGGRDVQRLQALLWPLYMTGYCIWDQLFQNQWYGAEQLVILSASSKTSLGLAQAIADGGDAPRVIGVTSASNEDFVRKVGLYDEVISYEQAAGLPEIPTTVVDMAGNAATADALRARLGEHLQYFISVGLTHWDKGGDEFGKDIPRHEFFFAPTYMLERSNAMEPGEFARLTQAFVMQGAARSVDWLTVNELSGIEALAERYPAIRAGKMDPSEGLIIKV
jgi:hypothetical protein